MDNLLYLLLVGNETLQILRRWYALC